MSYAKADDGSRIWYEVQGALPGVRTPLVLVQGLALDHHGWDSAISDFDDRPVILLDHRGTGGSDDQFTDDWSTRDFARDIIAVLDAAGVARAHVYGHSMGGRIAQWLGARHADRVVALVLGATSVGDSGGIARSARASEVLASGDPTGLTTLFYPDAWLADHPREARRVLPSAASASAMRAHLSAANKHDGPHPGNITVPTLIIQGTDDELTVPDNARLLACHIDDSSLELLDGQRHVYWIDRPDAHETVGRFLRQHDHPSDDQSP
ncbi:MAG TPA: alpha/beta fold hydrolase [Microlunatus sp.]